MNRIEIEIRSGIADINIKPKGIEVIIIDYDILGDEDGTVELRDGNAIISVYEADEEI